MHKRNALKRVLKFSLQMLHHQGAYCMILLKLHTPARVSPANFNTTYSNSFSIQNSIFTTFDATLFIADLITYAATPPD
jgi:hypothetical protein